MAIRLTINHSTLTKEGEQQPGGFLRAVYHLRDHENPNGVFDILEPRFESLKIADLAKQWFLINRPASERDTNEALLAHDQAADAPLRDFLPIKGIRGAFEYTSDDPICIAALDERVKRACAMIHADHLYDQLFHATSEDFFELSDSRATPSGEALPKISEEMRKKFSS
jgi:hypothetical protein